MSCAAAPAAASAAEPQCRSSEPLRISLTCVTLPSRVPSGPKVGGGHSLYGEALIQQAVGQSALQRLLAVARRAGNIDEGRTLGRKRRCRNEQRYAKAND
jgi:hypothetical protein